MGVCQSWHLLETVFQAQPLAVFVAEGFKNLSLVLCLHLRIIKRGIKLRIELLPQKQLLL